MDSKEVELELDKDQSTPTGKQPSQKEREFIELALKRAKRWRYRFDTAITTAKETYRFVVKGEHWPSDDKKKREDEGLFCIEHNYGIVHRDGVAGEILQNMPQGKYIGFDGKEEDKKLGEIGTSILRRIETNSRCDVKDRDTIKQCLVSGYPAFQEIVHEYPSHVSPNQEIFIQYLHAQYSVMLDPDAQVMDKPERGGPKWGMVIEDMPRAEYKREFPKSQVISFDEATGDEIGWWTTDNVRVAGYYCAESRKATMVLLSVGGRSMSYMVEKDGKEHKKILADVAAQTRDNPVLIEVKEVKGRKDVTIYEIKHYIINSREILKGPEDVDFDYIPIVPFEGKYDWDADGRKLYRGVYDNAKYANLMLDLWSTKASELVITGRQFKATPKQIQAHQKDWENSVGKKVLFYDIDPALPPSASPQELDTTTEMEQSVKMMQMSGDMIKDLTNRHEANIGEQGNETSGRAINARAQQGMTSNYEFINNIAAAVDYRTRIIESGIPRVYDYEMMVRIIGDDGRSKRTETINQSMPTSDGQGNMVQEYINDISKADFDTQVSVGPSFKNQAAETALYLDSVGRAQPELALLLGDLSLMALDFQYADEAANRVKAYINIKFPGLLDQIEGDGQSQEKAKIDAAVQQAVKQLQDQLMPGIQQAEQKITQDAQQMQQMAATIQDLQQKVQDATRLMNDKARDHQLNERKMALEEKKLTPPPDLSPQIAALQKQLNDLATVTADVMEQHRGMIEKGSTGNIPITSGTDEKLIRDLQSQMDMLQKELDDLKKQEEEDKKKELVPVPTPASPPPAQPITVIVDNKSGTIRKSFSITKTAEGKYQAEGTEETVE